MRMLQVLPYSAELILASSHMHIGSVNTTLWRVEAGTKRQQHLCTVYPSYGVEGSNKGKILEFSAW